MKTRQTSDHWVHRTERRRRKRDHAGAFRCVSAAASAGITNAQFHLADLYRSGIGVPRSLGNSAFWLEQAASGGHLEAMVRLAKLELIGRGPTQTIFDRENQPNQARSRMWAERAAAAGLPEGKAVLALILEHGQTVSRAEILRLLEDSAAAGDPSASLQLAIKLLEPSAETCDQMRVTRLLETAANKALPLASYLLGIAKQSGFGCDRDDEQAYGLYRQAARSGLIYGMARHGAALLAGLHERANPVEGETWLRRAASGGHGGAASIVGALRAGQDGLPSNFREAAQWFQLAADAGDAFGAKTAAVLSYLGFGNSSDPRTILGLLATSRTLAEKRSPDPASLFTTEDVPLAFTICATRWFESAARAGDQRAVLGVASCIAFGVDAPADAGAAQRYLDRASARQLLAAQQLTESHHGYITAPTAL